jgi:TorA maturation chaperone TorD
VGIGSVKKILSLFLRDLMICAWLATLFFAADDEKKLANFFSSSAAKNRVA